MVNKVASPAVLNTYHFLQLIRNFVCLVPWVLSA